MDHACITRAPLAFLTLFVACTRQMKWKRDLPSSSPSGVGPVALLRLPRVHRVRFTSKQYYHSSHSSERVCSCTHDFIHASLQRYQLTTSRRHCADTVTLELKQSGIYITYSILVLLVSFVPSCSCHITFRFPFGSNPDANIPSPLVTRITLGIDFEMA